LGPGCNCFGDEFREKATHSLVRFGKSRDFTRKGLATVAEFWYLDAVLFQERVGNGVEEFA
jgi:hypothetical protein